MMTRPLIITFLLLARALLCPAQWSLNDKPVIDSILRVLKTATSDSVKARANYSLSTLLFRDSAKAALYLEEGRKHSKDDPFLTALYHYYAANFYFEYDGARGESVFLKADSLLSRFNTKEVFRLRSMGWRNYGIMQQIKDDEKAYLDILLNKAIPLAKLSGDSDCLGGNYRSVGLIFKNSVQYEKAAFYYEKAIQTLKNTPTLASLAFSYINIAEIFVRLKKFPQAREALDNASAILRPHPKAELYANYYHSEGLYYHMLGQYDKAINSFDKGIARAEEYKMVHLISLLGFKKYETLTSQQKYGQAKQLLFYLIQHPSLRNTSNTILNYDELAKTYARMGNMPVAYKWVRKYAELKDSLYKSRLRDDLHAMEVKYRTLENEKKITDLKTENEKTALLLKNNRLMNWLLGSVSLLLLVATVLSLLFYRSNKRLSLQKELNHQQQLKDMAQQQQIQYAQAMLQGEEQERKRVARDLHDGLGGLLSGVQMNLSRLSGTTPPLTLDAELPKINRQLTHSVNELRRIARNMMPETLLKFGLETALRDLCESIAGPPAIIFQPLDIQPDNIPPKTQMTIYRIVQELLSNAIRHAKASHIVVQCSQHNGTFFITVEDNGSGFDTRIVNDVTGLGLANVKNRVDYLGGVIELSSAINEGTSVNIEINVNK